MFVLSCLTYWNHALDIRQAAREHDVDWERKEDAETRWDDAPAAATAAAAAVTESITYKTGCEVEVARRWVNSTDGQLNDDLRQHLTGHRYTPVFDTVVHSR